MPRHAVAFEAELDGHPGAHAGSVVQQAIGAVLWVELLAGGEAAEDIAALE